MFEEFEICRRGVVVYSIQGLVRVDFRNYRASIIGENAASFFSAPASKIQLQIIAYAKM